MFMLSAYKNSQYLHQHLLGFFFKYISTWLHLVLAVAGKVFDLSYSMWDV